MFEKYKVQCHGGTKMIYSVKARFNIKKMPEFYRKLTDGTIFNQKPDGHEIIDSMKRARITKPNVIQWTETCYCSLPIKHERETVYNNYLSDIETELTDGYREFEGKPFMDYIKKLAESKGQ